jgi:cadmium resistance protein CadD (predicted permease)
VNPAEVTSTIGVGSAVFVATNVDDLVLLIALFADARLHRAHVVAGQVLGIAALAAGSALCALGALVVPPEWVALLGLIPLALGFKALVDLRRDDDDDDEVPQQAGALRAIASVVGITVANGGDNLGVYVPLFAAQAGWRTVVMSSLFVLLTLAWCLAALALVRHPAVGARLRRWGRAALPVILIALGAWILLGARALVGL